MVELADPLEPLAKVQALRADRPGHAARDRRRKRVFGAALEQFDELLQAAGTVGPASAPLPLFYALSQAGRAIAAAHCSDDRWDFKGHGLDVTIGSSKIGRTLVRPDTPPNRGDAFSVVADSTGSDTLDGPVELGELWASIPNMPRVEGLGAESSEAIAMTIEPTLAPTIVWTEFPAEETGAWFSLDEAALPSGQVEAAVAARLAHYPTVERFELAGLSTADPRLRQLRFPTHHGGGGYRPVRDVGEPYLGDSALYLRPSVGSGGRPPSALMSWWAVLLALSSSLGTCRPRGPLRSTATAPGSPYPSRPDSAQRA